MTPNPSLNLTRWPVLSIGLGLLAFAAVDRDGLIAPAQRPITLSKNPFALREVEVQSLTFDPHHAQDSCSRDTWS